MAFVLLSISYILGLADMHLNTLAHCSRIAIPLMNYGNSATS